MKAYLIYSIIDYEEIMCNVYKVTRYFDSIGTVIVHWWNEGEREKGG